MVNRAGGEAGGIRAESQSGDSISVISQNFGRGRRKNGIVNANRRIGRRRCDDVLAALVPQNGAYGGVAAAVLVGFSKLNGPNLHG